MEHVDSLLTYGTVEVLGEQQVTGLRVRSRLDQSERTHTVDGVFVEIGLLLNMAFVMDVLALNAYGEIVIDCQTCTGVPGVFAVGDVTHVHDKQVLVAAGEGVKAALRAHEYLLAGR